MPDKKKLSSVGILTSLNRTTSNWPIAFPSMDPTVKQSLDHYQKSFQGVCPQSDVRLTCHPSCTVVSGRVLPPSVTTLTYEQITCRSCILSNQQYYHHAQGYYCILTPWIFINIMECGGLLLIFPRLEVR